MKTKQDNDVIDCIDAIYEENETQLLWPIRLRTVYDENQIGPRGDQSIGLVYIELETELSRPIWSGVVCDENQTRQRLDQSYMCDLCQKQ